MSRLENSRQGKQSLCWNNNPANFYAVLPRRRPLTDAEAMDDFLKQVEDELGDYGYDYFNS
jgi:hypothetical protein